jgi:ABC-2 type transport system permease protein
MIGYYARVLRSATVLARADMRAIYSWNTWCFAWVTRILSQVAFFALIGRLLKSEQQTHYLLIGNAVFVVVMISMFVTVSAAWERGSGTLPLLVASPAPPFLVFFGRGLCWLVDGSVCSVVALFALSLLFGLPLHWPTCLLAVPLIAGTGASGYCFAMSLSGIVLRKLELRNLVTNISYLSLMLLSGVEVPTSFLPLQLRDISEVLPLTHGLRAVRLLLASGGMRQVAIQMGLEGAVGAGWLIVSILVFRNLVNMAYKKGLIEFG